MTDKIPDDVRTSRRLIVAMAVLLAILLGSLAWGALRDF